MIDSLVQNNFLVVPQYIDSEVANVLYDDFVALSKTTRLVRDPQAPNSPAVHNYSPFLELLCNKTHKVSEIVGETVLPTYSYARIYTNGEVLSPHTDRAACEISATLHLGGDCSWPFFIQKPNGEQVSFELSPGDAIFYLGCAAPHWRNRYEGTQYAQVFLHYVSSKGPNAWAYFDNKQ